MRPKMTTEFKPFDGDTSLFAQYERDCFRNLRDREGKVLPVFRIAKKERAEKENRDPFGEHGERLEKRRTPRSAPPIVDLLLELERTMFFPEFPSRQHSLFANLGGHQTGYEGEIFLVLPHESARISISAVQDFKVSDPRTLCEYLRKQLQAKFALDDPIDLSRLAEYKGEYDKVDYQLHHHLLDFMDLIQGWFKRGVRDCKELDYVLRFWKKSLLVENMVCPDGRIGSEVIIQGAVRYERGHVS